MTKEQLVESGHRQVALSLLEEPRQKIDLSKDEQNHVRAYYLEEWVAKNSPDTPVRLSEVLPKLPKSLRLKGKFNSKTLKKNASNTALKIETKNGRLWASICKQNLPAGKIDLVRIVPNLLPYIAGVINAHKKYHLLDMRDVLVQKYPELLGIGIQDEELQEEFAKLIERDGYRYNLRIKDEYITNYLSSNNKAETIEQVFPDTKQKKIIPEGNGGGINIKCEFPDLKVEVDDETLALARLCAIQEYTRIISEHIMHKKGIFK